MPVTSSYRFSPFHPTKTLSILMAGLGWVSGLTGAALEDDFTSLSLEELGSIQVTSVSKRSESLNRVPAAISVVKADEIIRSGANNFPEALRLATGTDVNRVDAHQWAVTVRGFNDTFAQKLLVLMDGRSLYTPLFSGTFWQIHDALLEDLEQIEVVRGPGGTVWGANAVNGVISIVSKSARDTQGSLITGIFRSDLVSGGLRYGDTAGENVYYRVYVKYDDHDASRRKGGGEAWDAGFKKQAGFRMDWAPTSSNEFTLQGDHADLRHHAVTPQVVFPAYQAPAPATGYAYTMKGAIEQGGTNLLGRWTHRAENGGELSLQSYFDHSELRHPLMTDNRKTYDFDLRHRMSLGHQHELVYGGGYRDSRSDLRGSVVADIPHQIYVDRIYNLFLQDQITLLPDHLRLTLGAKVEHFDSIGTAWEPGTRLAWTPNDRQTIWASVARAVRTPSVYERRGRFNIGAAGAEPPTRPAPVLLSVLGNPDLKSEKLLAYELGYRVHAFQRFNVDLALFVNDYDDLRTSTERQNVATLPNYVGVESQFISAGRGKTYGGEMSVTFQALERWRVQALYSIIRADLKGPITPLTGKPQPPKMSAPDSQFSLRVSGEMTSQLFLDAGLRYVGEISSAGEVLTQLLGTRNVLPSNLTFDACLTWRASANVDVSIGARDIGKTHREYVPTFTTTEHTEVRTSYFVRTTLKFR
ncbi:MAG TPA: TonB-dependent receptor [Opitutaceae bacterium]|nr:TonB-dependent receptor [Opitutaceae bacterium]